jgi:outer membrane protein OmpA-like peptidoglycan-associated protein
LLRSARNDNNQYRHCEEELRRGGEAIGLITNKYINMKVPLRLIFLHVILLFIFMAKAADNLNFDQINNLLAQQKFTDAIPLLQEVLEQAPNNPDANFKTGLCYYFSPDKRNSALPFFQKAANKIGSKYNFAKQQNGIVPVDILFFIGDVFLHNQQPDSAIYYFVKYQRIVKDETAFDVQGRINFCVNAIREMGTPLNVNIENLGNSINSPGFENNPVVTIDNSVIFFSSNRPAANATSSASSGASNYDIYYSLKSPSGKWGKAVYFKYNTDADESPACLSVDGKMLIFSRKVKDNFDLFYSTFENENWTDPKSLGNSINSSADEKEASLSKDGNLLYFSSNRTGGYGKSDIYISKKTDNGTWSKPVNMGNEINTPENEVSPYIHPDGQVLYFSSNGNNEDGIGGLDVYYSKKNSTITWSKPQHINYPVNTSRDDINYQVTSGGKRYYTSLTDFNSFDIVEITGKQDEVEDFNYGSEPTKLFSEMNVMEVMEVEKEVEKEVQVSDIVEVQTEVEKEVKVVETLEVEKEVVKKDTSNEFSLENVNLDALDSTQREKIIQKVKDYYTNMMGNDKSVVFKTIYFSFNSAELLLLSKSELRVLVEYLYENPKVKVEVIGHTDILGNWDVNLNVSRERAGTVYKFLLENKIAHNRIIYYGKGSAAPIASNDTEDGRSKNRRVEIMLLR